MKSPTRLGRVVVGLALAATAGAGCILGESTTGSASDEVTHPVDSLIGAAASAERLIGTAVSHSALVNEPPYRDLLASELDYVTPENEAKWGSLQGSDPFRWDFSRLDALVDAARANGQAVKGHALVWHNQLPPFINDDLSAFKLAMYLSMHIFRVMPRYRDDIRAWDVVNEAIADDGTLRDTVFRRKLGESYIPLAFHLAHLADHDARLFYNDYNIDTINAKSNAVYELIARLVRDRVPIHGVGFQMHLEAQSAPTTAAIVANLQRFAALGLTVNISELDVRIAKLTGDHATKLAVQKQVYHRVIAACLQVPACESVTTWGLTDKHSWIDSTFGADDPLPFDELYRRKPAYYGMIDGFTSIPADAPGLAPNLVGNATFEVGSDGWTAWGGTLATTPSPVHTGARSAVVGSRTATWHAAVLDVRHLVAPGRRYDVSAHARIDAVSDGVRLSAKARCTGGADSYATLASGTATDATWVELAGELVVPTCSLEELVVYVEGPAPGVTLYVDDVAMRPQPGASGTNLVTNPGFETDATGWFGFGDPVVAATAAFAHAGAQSGHATNRTATWQGPATSILGATAGAYQASAWVRLGGEITADVHMTVKSRCAGTDQFVRVGTASATETGWAQLTGTLTVPSCALEELVVYFEGPAAGVDLYVDDVAVVGPP